jgi:hypothetical protein
MPWPKGVPRKRVQPLSPLDLSLPDESLIPTPESMSLPRFTWILLLEPITRFGSHFGLAASDTARFSVEAGNTIELDPSTGLVRISKGADHAYVPLSRVKLFGPRA